MGQVGNDPLSKNRLLSTHRPPATPGQQARQPAPYLNRRAWAVKAAPALASRPVRPCRSGGGAGPIHGSGKARPSQESPGAVACPGAPHHHKRGRVVSTPRLIIRGPSAAPIAIAHNYSNIYMQIP